MQGGNGKAFVDFQNDVTDKDIALAEREGFRSVEHLKRYTTLGMATDQGKTSNVNGLAHHGRADRPPIAADRHHDLPPALHAGRDRRARAATIAARHFRPTRLHAAHDWAAEQGAVFVETGLWLRAQWFPRAGETDWLRKRAPAR